MYNVKVVKDNKVQEVKNKFLCMKKKAMGTWYAHGTFKPYSLNRRDNKCTLSIYLFIKILSLV